MAERTREDADAGVMDVVRLMADGDWVTGVSNLKVAKDHGVSPATVKNWATNASRILRTLHEEDIEDIRARSLSTLERVVALAMKTKKAVNVRDAAGDTVTEFVDEPSLMAVVSAIELRAKLLGMVITKHEHRVKPVAHLTRKQHLEEMEKLEAEIASEKSRLLAEGTEE